MNNVKSTCNVSDTTDFVDNTTLSIDCETLSIRAANLKVSQRSVVSVEYQELSVYDDSNGVETTAYFTRDPACRVKPVSFILHDIDANTAAILKQLILPYVESLSADYRYAVPPVFQCTIDTKVSGTSDFNTSADSNTRRAFMTDAVDTTVLVECTMSSFMYLSADKILKIQVTPKYTYHTTVAVPSNENTITVRFTNEARDRIKAEGFDVFNEVYKALPFNDVSIDVITADRC
jgi:hypothetical protein